MCTPGNAAISTPRALPLQNLPALSLAPLPVRAWRTGLKLESEMLTVNLNVARQHRQAGGRRGEPQTLTREGL